MRPHSLTVTAFGAFAGTEHLDLDALGDAGLFLLHGPTGAGKSTLLDAIGFALFGRVPGARNAAKRLRSDHADPGVRTEVQLEATLAGRRARITRRPQQERPKARGAGTTTEQASLLLEVQVDGEWHALSRSIQEGAGEIDSWLGMSAEQFFQVVLLPQGEFATFLRASSTDRGDLLERLFATDRFASLEGWLSERHRSSRAAVGEREQRLSEVCHRVAEAALLSDGPAPGAPHEVPDDDQGPWARSLLAAAQQRTVVTGQSLARCRDAVAEALTAWQRAQALAERQRRRAALQAQHDSLAAQVAEIEQVRAEADGARRAAPVASRRDDLVTAERELATAVRGHVAALAALNPDDRALGEEQLAGRVGQVSQWVGRLSEAGRHSRTAATRRQEAADAQMRRAAAATRLLALDERLVVLPAERVAVDHALSVARARARELSGAGARADSLQLMVKVARGWADDTSALAAAREAVAQAQERVRTAEQALDDLEVRRVDSMIAELASKLPDGDPCPVCGSQSHPDMAQFARDDVTEADLRSARQAVQQAHAGHGGLRDELVGLQQRVADRGGRLTEAGLVDEQRLAGSTGAEVVAWVERAADEAHSDAARLADAEREVQSLEQQVAALGRTAAELDVLRERHEGEQTAAQSRRAAADQQATEAEAAVAEILDEVRAGTDDLEVALTTTQARAVSLQQALESGQLRRTAERSNLLAEQRLHEAVLTAGFPDLGAAGAAVRELAWSASAEARLRAHDEQVAAVRAALSDPDVQVDLEPAAPVDTAGAAHTTAVEQERVAAAASTTAERVHSQLASLVPQVDELLTRLEPLRASAAVAREMSELAAGQGSNRLRMTLSAFVLAARLEQVAAAASQRLQRMSGGRYTLAHTVERSGPARRAGLGLSVNDAWTGQERSPETLSGGETFIASLALALGLSDVVAEESGGARIDALFVDEGFGSLDSDTLDEVMDVLDGLREGGRVVGVVSHVSELRDRIQAQVTVDKGRHGSTLRVAGV